MTTSLREHKTGLRGKGNERDQRKCGGLLRQLRTVMQSIPLVKKCS